MTKPHYQSIQIFYNGFQLVLTVESESTFYLTMPQDIHSKSSIKPGAYLIKPKEITVSAWGTLSSSNLSCLLRQKEEDLFKNEIINFKLYSVDGTFASSHHFYVFSPLKNWAICMPSSPFSQFLAILRISALNSKESVIPFMINTDKTTPLNLEALKNHVPDSVIEDIRHYGNQYGVVSNLRLAYFLAQVQTESHFEGTTEQIGRYSKSNVLKFFKSCKDGVKAKPKPCFLKPEDAGPYVGNAEKLANLVYTYRKGLGNKNAGDGFKFIGRGIIQLTGRDNYQSFADTIGDQQIMTHPNLINTKYPVISALYYFKKRNFWSIVDKGNSDSHLKSSVTELTGKINTGRLGLTERLAATKEFCQILGVQLSI